MKKLKFPTPYTVLMLVIILAASLTFLLPSGAYNTLQYNKANNTFVIHTSDRINQIYFCNCFILSVT